MFNFLKIFIGRDKHLYRYIQDTFQIVPNNIELYKLALLHRSASITTETGRVMNNERLEFLGDSVIDSIVSEMLFIEYPEMDEGEMTQLRARIVNRDKLNHLAKRLDLERMIISTSSGIGINKQNILGDALEALFGAIYLDKGYNQANRTLIKLVSEHLNIDEIHHTEQDFKSRIIEWGQKRQKNVKFQSAEVDNFNESEPEFLAFLYINEEEMSKGLGRSKKDAEQRAAQKFYESHKGDFINGVNSDKYHAIK